MTLRGLQSVIRYASTVRTHAEVGDMIAIFAIGLVLGFILGFTDGVRERRIGAPKPCNDLRLDVRRNEAEQILTQIIRERSR
jgi:hypothetical protein